MRLVESVEQFGFPIIAPIENINLMFKDRLHSGAKKNDIIWKALIKDQNFSSFSISKVALQTSDIMEDGARSDIKRFYGLLFVPVLDFPNTNPPSEYNFVIVLDPTEDHLLNLQFCIPKVDLVKDDIPLLIQINRICNGISSFYSVTEYKGSGYKFKVRFNERGGIIITYDMMLF